MFSFRDRIGWIDQSDKSVELRGRVTNANVRESADCLAEFLTNRLSVECRVFEADDHTYFVGCAQNFLLYLVGLGFDRIVAVKLDDCPFGKSVLEDYVRAYLPAKSQAPKHL